MKPKTKSRLVGGVLITSVMGILALDEANGQELNIGNGKKNPTIVGTQPKVYSEECSTLPDWHDYIGDYVELSRIYDCNVQRLLDQGYVGGILEYFELPPRPPRTIRVENVRRKVFE